MDEEKREEQVREEEKGAQEVQSASENAPDGGVDAPEQTSACAGDAAQQVSEEAQAEDAQETQEQAEEHTAPESAAEEAGAKIAWLSTQLIEAKATAAATALGVAPEKVKYVLRLSDISGIDITDADADKRITAAVKQVINELPELKGGAANTTGTQGYFARRASAPMTAFERGLEGKV